MYMIKELNLHGEDLQVHKMNPSEFTIKKNVLTLWSLAVDPLFSLFRVWRLAEWLFGTLRFPPLCRDNC